MSADILIQNQSATIMRPFFRLFLCGLATAAAVAQITFMSAELPQKIDQDYWEAFVDTSDQDVRLLLGQKGGPQVWDFSYQGEGEDIHRMDIVAPSDQGHGDPFSRADFAERVTKQQSGCQTWSYHRIVSGAGRWYYGLRDGCKSPEPTTVFDAPTLDLPEEIVFGKSWTRSVSWRDVIDPGLFPLEVSVRFESQGKVDAFGTLVLPEIGEVEALRVNEVNSYSITDLTFGIPLDTQVFRNYYWLVPGIGKAVHIISTAGTVAPPEDFSTAKTVLRVFESSRMVPPPPTRAPVQNLRIEIKGKQVFLTWDHEDLRAEYEVEIRSGFDPSSPWSVSASTRNNFWFDDLLPNHGARFYSVFSSHQ